MIVHASETFNNMTSSQMDKMLGNFSQAEKVSFLVNFVL